MGGLHLSWYCQLYTQNIWLGIKENLFYFKSKGNDQKPAVIARGAPQLI